MPRIFAGKVARSRLLSSKMFIVLVLDQPTARESRRALLKNLEQGSWKQFLLVKTAVAFAMDKTVYLGGQFCVQVSPGCVFLLNEESCIAFASQAWSKIDSEVEACGRVHTKS